MEQRAALQVDEGRLYILRIGQRDVKLEVSSSVYHIPCRQEPTQMARLRHTPDRRLDEAH